MRDARRILVYGVTGSGKSTLAARIAEGRGLPYHSVDDEIGWLPKWTERPPDEQIRLADEITASPGWVLDTAYGAWRPIVLERVELVVALDYRRWVSLGRLLRRTTSRLVTRTPVCNGNVENARQILSTDSIIAWHFRSFRRKRERIRGWEADPSFPPMVRLTSPKSTERWLTEFTS
ncbi:MAG: adenylate kinase [Actinomycetota bacterium]